MRKIFLLLSFFTVIPSPVCSDIDFQAAFGLPPSVTTSSKYEIVLARHDKCDEENAHKRYFDTGSTLAYVTPWNSHGYDIVKIFKGKFNYVSPVWFNIKRVSESRFIINGAHDIDEKWMSEVRGQVNGDIMGKIVPRFALDEWSPADYDTVMKSTGEAAVLANLIVEEVLKHNLDGVVLEVTVMVVLQSVLYFMSESLHKNGKEIIVVIPPTRPGSETWFGPNQLEALAGFIDHFSLMTYDYSTPQKPGPNAPIEWMEDTIRTLTRTTNRPKVMLGLNLYGMDYSPNGAEPITGTRFLELLRTYKPDIKWDREVEEHWFEYKDKIGKHVVWYPSIKSLQARISLAEDFGVGLAMWEVGQGLDYFYDLL